MQAPNSSTRSMFYSYYAISLITLIFILFKGKADSFLSLYSCHTDSLNVLMRGITFLGDGIFAVLFASAFIFYKFRISVFLLLSWLFSGLITQLLKRFLFSSELRPFAYFSQQGINIYEVPGIEIHAFHSFPSGHTATAFAVFIGLAFFLTKTWQKISLLLLASLIGFSRIYLGQHFPADVLAGSVIGMFSSLLLYSIILKWKSPFLDKSVQKMLK
ncbi:MAG: phosphatase PAP2 family protein [Bacteroidales bacterium]|nr:phosphatase PAP2 family protein [Bacteroidales bacterium]MCF8390802.1 phosphatase PAP2 family protein [Bacteroidales bacterium]